MINWFCSDSILIYYLFYCNIATLLTLQKLQNIPRLLPWVKIWVGTNFFPKCHLLGFMVLLSTKGVAKCNIFVFHCNNVTLLLIEN